MVVMTFLTSKANVTFGRKQYVLKLGILCSAFEIGKSEATLLLPTAEKAGCPLTFGGRVKCQVHLPSIASGFLYVSDVIHACGENKP